MIDFTDCKQFKKSYNGANGNKLCIEYQGERYMLKFPATPTKKTELSYANSCISEYIACHIYDIAGIPVQKTLLGMFTREGKDKIVVACKDFTFPDYVLQDFGSIKNQVIDSAHNGYGTELSDILNAIDNQMVSDPVAIKTRFWDMFVMDAFLGNFDRHNGNWGFLYNAKTDEITLAPVYDCGSCLFPQADREAVIKIMNDTGELNARVYNYPNSTIKENDKKINYYNFLTTTNNVDCIASIKKLVPVMTERYADIISLINDTPYIDNTQKDFYKCILQSRFDKILVPAYQRALNFQKETIEFNNEVDIEDIDGYDPGEDN